MAEITLDDETTAALTLFNEYVAADRERTQREKRLKKAERAKDDAAALVKKLSKGGSSKERSEAEAAYLAAAEKWKAMRDGKEPPADSPGAKTTRSAEPEADADTATEAEARTDDKTEAEAQGDDDKTRTEPGPEAEAEEATEAQPEAEVRLETEATDEADTGDEADSNEKPAD